MAGGNKLKQMTGTVSTKRLKMGCRRLRRSKAKKKEEPNLKRTLFFLNVPDWLNQFEDILDIFRPFGPIAKMEMFGSDASGRWGVVDYHHPVAEFAKESLSAMMDVRVASAEKSEERRRKRLRQQGKLEGRTASGRRRRRAASKAKVAPQSSSSMALGTLLRGKHNQQHSGVNRSRTKNQRAGPRQEPPEQPIHDAALNYDDDGMIVDAVYGEWDPLAESILRESAAALAVANIGNPLLVVTPPDGGSNGAAAGGGGDSRPVADGNGMFGYHIAT